MDSQPMKIEFISFPEATNLQQQIFIEIQNSTNYIIFPTLK